MGQRDYVAGWEVVVEGIHGGFGVGRGCGFCVGLFAVCCLLFVLWR
jgi:hypothetical protein